MARSTFQDSIVLVGDSLTQNTDAGSFSHRMTAAYSRKLDVLNRGYGGYNSAWALPLFDEIFARKEEGQSKSSGSCEGSSSVVRMVTLWFGTNDSVLPSKAQHLPLSDFTSNLHTMLTNLTSPESPYAVSETPVSIILITPAPCILSQMGKEQRESRTVQRTREFRDAVLEIGEEWKGRENEQAATGTGSGTGTGTGTGLTGGDGGGERKWWKIETIDLWEAMVDDAGGEGDELAPYLSDGIHFSSKGYEVLWNRVERVIKTKFSGRGLDWTDQDDLPLRVPWWGHVKPSRPESVVEQMKLPSFR